MSLCTSLTYHEPTDTVYGFEDDGEERSRDLVTSALCIMAVGVVEKWSYPLGFYFTGKGTKASFVMKALKQTIPAVEDQGFSILGVTTDQGSNYETAFRLLGATEFDPRMSIGNKTYFVHRDPPHLLKSARNYLLNGEVKVPGFSDSARWSHIQQLHAINDKKQYETSTKIV